MGIIAEAIFILIYLNIAKGECEAGYEDEFINSMGGYVDNGFNYRLLKPSVRTTENNFEYSYDGLDYNPETKLYKILTSNIGFRSINIISQNNEVFKLCNILKKFYTPNGIAVHIFLYANNRYYYIDCIYCDIYAFLSCIYLYYYSCSIDHFAYYDSILKSTQNIQSNNNRTDLIITILKEKKKRQNIVYGNNNSLINYQNNVLKSNNNFNSQSTELNFSTAWWLSHNLQSSDAAYLSPKYNIVTHSNTNQKGFTYTNGYYINNNFKPTEYNILNNANGINNNYKMQNVVTNNANLESKMNYQLPCMGNNGQPNAQSYLLPEKEDNLINYNTPTNIESKICDKLRNSYTISTIPCNRNYGLPNAESYLIPEEQKPTTNFYIYQDSNNRNYEQPNAESYLIPYEQKKNDKNSILKFNAPNPNRNHDKIITQQVNYAPKSNVINENYQSNYATAKSVYLTTQTIPKVLSIPDNLNYNRIDPPLQLNILNQAPISWTVDNQVNNNKKLIYQDTKPINWWNAKNYWAPYKYSQYTDKNKEIDTNTQTFIPMNKISYVNPKSNVYNILPKKFDGVVANLPKYTDVLNYNQKYKAIYPSNYVQNDQRNSFTTIGASSISDGIKIPTTNKFLRQTQYQDSNGVLSNTFIYNPFKYYQVPNAFEEHHANNDKKNVLYDSFTYSNPLKTYKEYIKTDKANLNDLPFLNNVFDYYQEPNALKIYQDKPDERVLPSLDNPYELYQTPENHLQPYILPCKYSVWNTLPTFKTPTYDMVQPQLSYLNPFINNSNKPTEIASPKLTTSDTFYDKFKRLYSRDFMKVLPNSYTESNSGKPYYFYQNRPGLSDSNLLYENKIEDKQSLNYFKTEAISSDPNLKKTDSFKDLTSTIKSALTNGENNYLIDTSLCTPYSDKNPSFTSNYVYAPVLWPKYLNTNTKWSFSPVNNQIPEVKYPQNYNGLYQTPYGSSDSVSSIQSPLINTIENVPKNKENDYSIDPSSGIPNFISNYDISERNPSIAPNYVHSNVLWPNYVKRNWSYLPLKNQIPEFKYQHNYNGLYQNQYSLPDFASAIQSPVINSIENISTNMEYNYSIDPSSRVPNVISKNKLFDTNTPNYVDNDVWSNYPKWSYSPIIYQKPPVRYPRYYDGLYEVPYGKAYNIDLNKQNLPPQTPYNNFNIYWQNPSENVDSNKKEIEEPNIENIKIRNLKPTILLNDKDKLIDSIETPGETKYFTKSSLQFNSPKIRPIKPSLSLPYLNNQPYFQDIPRIFDSNYATPQSQVMASYFPFKLQNKIQNIPSSQYLPYNKERYPNDQADNSNPFIYQNIGNNKLIPYKYFENDRSLPSENPPYQIEEGTQINNPEAFTFDTDATRPVAEKNYANYQTPTQKINNIDPICTSYSRLPLKSIRADESTPKTDLPLIINPLTKYYRNLSLQPIRFTTDTPENVLVNKLSTPNNISYYKLPITKNGNVNYNTGTLLPLSKTVNVFPNTYSSNNEKLQWKNSDIIQNGENLSPAYLVNNHDTFLTPTYNGMSSNIISVPNSIKYQSSLKPSNQNAALTSIDGDAALEFQTYKLPDIAEAESAATIMPLPNFVNTFGSKFPSEISNSENISIKPSHQYLNYLTPENTKDTFATETNLPKFESKNINYIQMPSGSSGLNLNFNIIYSTSSGFFPKLQKISSNPYWCQFLKPKLGNRQQSPSQMIINSGPLGMGLLPIAPIASSPRQSQLMQSLKSSDNVVQNSPLAYDWGQKFTCFNPENESPEASSMIQAPRMGPNRNITPSFKSLNYQTLGPTITQAQPTYLPVWPQVSSTNPFVYSIFPKFNSNTKQSTSFLPQYVTTDTSSLPEHTYGVNMANVWNSMPLLKYNNYKPKHSASFAPMVSQNVLPENFPETTCQILPTPNMETILNFNTYTNKRVPFYKSLINNIPQYINYINKSNLKNPIIYDKDYSNRPKPIKLRYYDGPYYSTKYPQNFLESIKQGTGSNDKLATIPTLFDNENNLKQNVPDVSNIDSYYVNPYLNKVNPNFLQYQQDSPVKYKDKEILPNDRIVIQNKAVYLNQNKSPNIFTPWYQPIKLTRLPYIHFVSQPKLNSAFSEDSAPVEENMYSVENPKATVSYLPFDTESILTSVDSTYVDSQYNTNGNKAQNVQPSSSNSLKYSTDSLPNVNYEPVGNSLPTTSISNYIPTVDNYNKIKPIWLNINHGENLIPEISQRNNNLNTNYIENNKNNNLAAFFPKINTATSNIIPPNKADYPNLTQYVPDMNSANYITNTQEKGTRKPNQQESFFELPKITTMYKENQKDKTFDKIAEHPQNNLEYYTTVVDNILPDEKLKESEIFYKKLTKNIPADIGTPSNQNIFGAALNKPIQYTNLPCPDFINRPDLFNTNYYWNNPQSDKTLPLNQFGSKQFNYELDNHGNIVPTNVESYANYQPYESHSKPLSFDKIKSDQNINIYNSNDFNYPENLRDNQPLTVTAKNVIPSSYNGFANTFGSTNTYPFTKYIQHQVNNYFPNYKYLNVHPNIEKNTVTNTDLKNSQQYDPGKQIYVGNPINNYIEPNNQISMKYNVLDNSNKINTVEFNKIPKMYSVDTPENSVEYKPLEPKLTENDFKTIANKIAKELVDKFKSGLVNTDQEIEIPKQVLVNYEPNINKILKTENPYLNIGMWYSNIKILKPKIVLDQTEAWVLNFIPIVEKNQIKYFLSPEYVQSLVDEYVTKHYGKPKVLTGVYSPNRVANIEYNELYQNGGTPMFLWPTLCPCGCNKAGCKCLEWNQ